MSPLWKLSICSGAGRPVHGRARRHRLAHQADVGHEEEGEGKIDLGVQPAVLGEAAGRHCHLEDAEHGLTGTVDVEVLAATCLRLRVWHFPGHVFMQACHDCLLHPRVAGDKTDAWGSEKGDGALD